MKTEKATLSIGPIIENTLLINETLSALLWELMHVDHRRTLLVYGELRSRGFVFEFIGDTLPEQYEWPSRVTHEILEEIQSDVIDHLQTHHVPPYCYLGTHEDDGASLGVWPNLQSIQNAIDDGELVSFDDNGQALPEGYTGDAVYTNHHGNMTCGHVVDGEFVKTYWDCV